MQNIASIPKKTGPGVLLMRDMPDIGEASWKYLLAMWYLLAFWQDRADCLDVICSTEIPEGTACSVCVSSVPIGIRFAMQFLI